MRKTLKHKVQTLQLELKLDLEVKVKTLEDIAETKKLRSSILKKLQQHGVNTTDWTCVNLFLENPRIAGKRLYNMSNEEMQLLIKKLGSILGKDATKKQEIERITKLN
jgi:hypothetical protein